ncbi:hypothetical protein CAPTEDRAFT_228138 [Capitella teleta]|uniref:SHSP domain-containing protein n=1 Tax=Capitella teleta TaxID=283909 RepID=R7UMK2_CAPTE|nr:hypothetical protein CAPTEDRAFT_228138 [Capitella teleta]|eukprot:ELU05152.1 hypothetical protein CAPTEDRAFT_228138 [Capitella teleta]
MPGGICTDQSVAIRPVELHLLSLRLDFIGEAITRSQRYPGSAAMATGLLTLPRFSSDLTPPRSMLSPPGQSPIHGSPSQPLSPSSMRSPWIRLFKLFQSKNRQELDRSKNSSSSNSIKVGDNGASECDGRASPRKKDIKEEDAKVKRNIYRRPNSRAVFNQRLSPGGLTDASRNPGRRKSDPINDPPNEPSQVAPLPSEANSYRRPRSCSMPAVCHGQGLQRRMEKVKLDEMRKQTTFQEDISIVYYEEDEFNERLVQADEIDDIIDEASSSDEAGPSTPETRRSTTNLDEGTSVRPGECKSIDIPAHFSLGKTRRGLRIMMEIDESCVRRKTCVRAMSGGKTLVVLSYKPQSEGHLTEHKDVINLPVNIDPFSVKANMLKSGHLCIQAPLRKESI